MKAIYSCTGAMLAILAGAAIFRPHLMNAGPGPAATVNSAAAPAAIPAQKMRLADNYGKLPLGFEANQGQTDSRVKFLSRGRGYSLFLTGDEAVLTLGSTSQNAKGKSQKAKVKAGGAPPLAGRPDTVGKSADALVAPTFRSAHAGLKSGATTAHAGLKPAATTAVDKPTTDHGPRTTDSVLRMKLVGANAHAAVTGADELPGKSNYFIGNDPKKWRTNVPNYAKVKYQNVYPGVDLVYYGNQGGQLEYDFVVAPGTDPDAIRLALSGDLEVGSRQSAVGSGDPGVGSRQSAVGSGTQSPTLLQSKIQNPKSKIDPNGDLVIKTDDGEIRFHKPVVYQEAESEVRGPKSEVQDEKRNTTANPKSKIQNREFLDGHYVLQANNQVGFKVPSYDHTRPLVIDPTLTYSTYLGGSSDDGGGGIAVDSSGNAYVTGFACSTDFPTVDPLQATNHGECDAFVAKLNASGSALVYSTYLGGSGAEDFSNGSPTVGIAVDSSGNAYVTGLTSSTDFPTVNPFQATNKAFATTGNFTAFVAKLNSTGSALVYSTYLGGSVWDWGNAIAVDSSGNAYVTGQTASGDFPTMNSLQGKNGSWEAFVTKLNTAGSALVYSTYLGGSYWQAGNGIAVDSSGNAYVTGGTSSTDFPTVNPLQATNNAVYGASTGFVSKLNAAGSALVYSTYLGGSRTETANAIAVDSSGNAYVTGWTESTDFPTANPFQATCDGCGGYYGTIDAFVAKLNAAGSALVYSTYLGGTSDDQGNGIAVDSSGNAYVTGWTDSTDFPTVNPIQATRVGALNAFVLEFNAVGSALVYSTYLGGSNVDKGSGIAVDSSGNAYITGSTDSTNFPTANPIQATCGSCSFNSSTGGWNSNAFVAKISPGGTAPTASLSSTSLSFGSQGLNTPSTPQTVTVTNSGTANLSISTVTLGGTNASDFATSADTCTGATVTPTDACTVSVMFTPSATGGRSASLNFTDNASSSPQTVSLTGTGGPAALVITASSASTTYGGAVPTITASYAGFVNGDTAASLTTPPTCSTTATSSSPVGSYPSTCAGAVDANYTISYTAGTVTVGQASLTITASSGSMTYGGAVPTITPSYTGFVIGDTAGSLTTRPTCTTTATSSSPVGSYPSTCSGAVDANYTISYTAGTVTVGKALLTITAPSPTITLGSTIPSFTPTYNGFVNGQSAGSLTTQPVCTTTATSSSPAGTYPITCSGAVDSNYNISYVPGTLTITGTGTAPVISFSPQTLTFGNQPVGTTSYFYTEIVTNTGTGNLIISSVTLGGANPGDFAQTFAGCSGVTLPPNSTCNLTLTFAPTAVGSRSASLSFTDNASNSPQAVAISGTGVQGIVLNPATLILGYQSRNTTSPARVVALANTLNTAMAISIATSGDFAQTNTCGGSVPARSTCTISVTFTPSIVGLETGTLTVTDAAANSPQTAALSGRGVAQPVVLPAAVPSGR